MIAFLFLFGMKVRKKAKIRNRYNQVPHLTKGTVWENDKNTRKHHIQESQAVSPFTTGDHKAEGCKTLTRQYGKDKHKIKKIQKITALDWSVRKLLEVLN